MAKAFAGIEAGGDAASLGHAEWLALIGDPTYADAVLDRLVHNAHRIELNGESLRRTRKPGRKA